MAAKQRWTSSVDAVGLLGSMLDSISAPGSKTVFKDNMQCVVGKDASLSQCSLIAYISRCIHG